ncbi:MAG: tRNA dihydrouridine synthase DusB [Candidatus Riflebacteria bacterium]|nr:tRNA dihydrouridine synthase DusB [Candidatus Riflebacteria bacterium]
MSIKSLIKPLKIKGITFPNNLVLAPMAGVTDGPFRYFCSKLGAGLTVSELASAKAVLLGNKTTIRMLNYTLQPRPFSAQIFGHDPSDMAEAASKIEKMGVCELIDINMGCPVAKVVKSGAGSAMMKTPELARKIISAVKNAVKIPVTVKFRLGWTESQINVIDFTKMTLDAGADAITVHARTREAGYSGTADWKRLENMQNLCGSVPFIANGDIKSSEDIIKVHEISGASGFMIGRGAIGNPWLFRKIISESSESSSSDVPEMSSELKFELFRDHLIESLVEHGNKGVALFRVHLFAYLRGHPNASQFRREMCSERNPTVVLNNGKTFFFRNVLTCIDHQHKMTE